MLEENINAKLLAFTVVVPMFRLKALCVRVPVYVEQSSDRQLAVALIVILPEVDARITSSAAVGATPPTQVLVAAQFPPPLAAVIVAIVIPQVNQILQMEY
jgi:hypothetical protein